ncbi:hypothetical protein TC41_1156 [Alicyclobacillus acidocaldarius subsp. acidocaldarius Tc-4-1]|uniref:Uncharacterized protein n=1 Tax=Alicyclobacillus acidocaldarius (strain Tc-4-1) TaxID=1048834 RepID=F8IGT6_ALIAT|nr:hypothetical protein TC41_1156 [Alicyclobacillus acidocaldarius subsp. acidocaldarius Tc-4-1]
MRLVRRQLIAVKHHNPGFWNLHDTDGVDDRTDAMQLV